MRLKFLIQIIKTMLRCKGYEWYSPYVRRVMEEEDESGARMRELPPVEPEKTYIGIDIPYGSDKGLATIFKGKDDKLILEEVKEIMAVVRCRDCKHYIASIKGCGRNPCIEAWERYDFCSYGEGTSRKGEQGE